ncbi:MAG TPA: NAD(P)H-quinone oxidoreductase [Stellaceae bacterium]
MATLPETMMAIEITKPGAPEVLKPGTRPVPKPGKGEVLIAVAAAGVNRPDVMQRRGLYPPPAGASDIPGLEIAGHVVALGEGARLKIGDAVTALVSGGGYAQYCVAPEPQCLPVPAGFSMAEAAALPETFFTVWHNLFERGQLAKGESVLIHGGSSGIGTAAIQLAREFGAKEIFATAGSAEKCAACERLGATRAINYKTEDFATVVKAATGNRGVDVVLDMVAGDYLQRNLDLLAMDGRLVIIAFLHGTKAEIDFNGVLRRRLTITGSGLRPRPVAEKGAIADGLRSHVWHLLDEGKIKPLIDKVFPLADAAGAHALMESSAHIGKIVLTV